MRRLVLLPLLTALLTACGSTPRVDPALQLDTYSDQPYARVLDATVRGGNVDYHAFNDELETQLNIYLDAVARFGPRETPELFPTEQDELAFYINAYNAIMLRLWLDKGARTAKPTDSVQWLVWFTVPQWTIDGSNMTLDSLEQRLIRPDYDDGRVHAALVCGAVDCPPLRGEPFVGDRLDAQLDDQMRRWLTDPSGDGLRVEPDGTVKLSAIFGWYRDDFRETGGLAAMLEKYLDESDPRKIQAVTAARNNNLEFMGYDWTINLAPQP